ncbi:hypothetical protein KM043_018113 [Ampulex compressa]|nr:hypothetical protein KM043_018113 [Ampulex compressa]
MFINKKSSLPPRPHLPDPEHMLEDMNNAAMNDAAFRIINKDNTSTENAYDPTNTSDFDIYKNVKVYLNIRQQLKHLESILLKKEQELLTENEEIKRLAADIRKQAEAALIT